MKAVTPNYETYGGPHSYNDCPAIVGQTQNVSNQGRNQFFQGASHSQNPPQAYQASGYQALVHQTPIHQPQVVTTSEFTNFMKANYAILKNMQTNMTALTNLNIKLKNMFGQFMKMNTASSSDSRTLPVFSTTISRSKEEEVIELDDSLRWAKVSQSLCVRRSINKDSHDKNSVLANSKNSAKKVAVYVRKNKQTDNTSTNVISNKENVIDVDVANASKAKNLLCVSCMHNVLILCHDKCLANHRLNMHSNARRTLSNKSRTSKSSDTTYVVLKTRFSEKLAQSKTLDTTFVVSKPKIDVGSASKAKNKTNDVIRLQALVDKRKVIFIEDTVRQALQLNDADSIDCLPNKEIFAELARIGYEKPSTNLVRNVDSSSKFYMYLRFLQLMIAAQVGMMVPQQVNDDVVDDVDVDVALQKRRLRFGKVKALKQDKMAQDLEITKLKQRLRKLEKKRKCIQTGGIIAEIDADEDVTLEEVDAEKDAKVAEKDVDAQGRLEESQEQIYHLDLEHAQKVLITAAATIITAPPSAAKRRKGVVIRDPEETATPSIIVHSKSKSKDKEKGILVKRKEKQDNAVLRYHALKRKLQTEAQAMKNMMKIEKELEEEASKALKRKSKNDAYTKATPLALKVPVVDYQIHTEHNKPYYKIIRADGTRQLFLSFISLLRNFDREDLEMLWQIVQEIFTSSKPKNFSDDFLLNALKTTFGIDAAEDFKEYTPRDYYCWYKLKLLDNAADSRLKLLEESVVADE
nr:hypothetical protein [Tanacetum cinerariifolium]